MWCDKSQFAAMAASKRLQRKFEGRREVEVALKRHRRGALAASPKLPNPYGAASAPAELPRGQTERGKRKTEKTRRSLRAGYLRTSEGKRPMFDPAWEDSLLTTDLEDIRAIEAMERYHASANAMPRTCRLAKCRRHRVCLGPMLRPPGMPLPPRYHQHRDRGFRVLCILESDPPLTRLKLQTILDKGPEFYALIIRHPLIRPEDFLAYRIAASRQARRAAKERPRST